jgi:hypothetical protein
VQTHPFSTPQKNQSNFFSAGKIMATVFWDSKGIIHLDFLTGQKTINAQYYSTLLNEKVSRQFAQSEEKGRIQFSSSKTTIVLTLQL